MQASNFFSSAGKALDFGSSKDEMVKSQLGLFFSFLQTFLADAKTALSSDGNRVSCHKDESIKYEIHTSNYEVYSIE